MAGVVVPVCIPLARIPLARQELNNHENIIKLYNVLKADNDRDIYLVFEYMGARASPSTAQFYSILIRTPAQAEAGRVGRKAGRCYRRKTQTNSVGTGHCADTDLHAVIRANILEEVHKQYIMYQLL